MASMASLGRRIRLEKVKTFQLPQVPKDIRSFELTQPNHLTETIDKKTFLRKSGFVDDAEEEYVQIYASDMGLHYLQTNSKWIADGTFKTARFPFLQLYLIGTYVGTHQKFVPAVFCLLTHKNERTYIDMLKTVIELVGDISHVQYLNLDFEVSMLSAVKHLMPAVEIGGCFFHFRANLRKNLQEKGLIGLFNDSISFRQLILMIAGLALFQKVKLERSTMNVFQATTGTTMKNGRRRGTKMNC